MDNQKLDAITAQLYNEFFSRNRDLFQKAPLEYWQLARRYVDQERRKIKYVSSNRKKN
ncbi:MAG: hypothetical protein AABY22_26595 [Nanoarchaeota archaeon]